MISIAQLKNQLTKDIKQVFPNLDIDNRISFDKYSAKNQIRVYRSLFSYVYEFLGMKEAEYEFFRAKKYIDILYKVAENLIISESLKESKNKDSSFFKEREMYYSSQFGNEIHKKFCKEHNLVFQDSSKLKKITLDYLGTFLRDFYGYKYEYFGTWIEEQKIDFTLYDSFSVKCGFNEQGYFDAWVYVSDNFYTKAFLGSDCSLIENNEKNISEVLQKIDDYCRLMLPDKFLIKYDEAYKRKGHYIDMSGRFHYMQEEKMTLNQIADFLKEFYGSKIKILQVSNDKQEIDFILYNALSFKCGLDDHKSFGAALQLPNGFGTTSFLGYECSLIENNESDISVALQKIDDFCRARLPDKYLEKYDNVCKEKEN